MLPAKVKLTKELACKLHDIRINTPVNNEILTAENLSKSIGNNRAWMSQIESRRLKNIKREDIIKIYKLLYNINSDNEAEKKAEMDLLKFLKGSSNHNYFISYGSHIENEETLNKETKKQSNNDTLDKSTMKKIDINFYMNCDTIKQELINFYNSLDNIKDQLIFSNYIAKYKYDILDNTLETFGIASTIPLSNYQYASFEQQEIINKKIYDLQVELNKLNYIKTATIYNSNVKLYLEALNKKNIFSEEKLVRLFKLLIDIISKFDESTSLADKIQYINDYISIINLYTNIKGDSLNIDKLTINSDVNVIKTTLDCVQIYVNGLDSNFYFIDKLSDIFF